MSLSMHSIYFFIRKSLVFVNGGNWQSKAVSELRSPNAMSVSIASNLRLEHLPKVRSIISNSLYLHKKAIFFSIDIYVYAHKLHETCQDKAN